jgi:hypothetical protein
MFGLIYAAVTALHARAGYCARAMQDRLALGAAAGP